MCLCPPLLMADESCVLRGETSGQLTQDSATAPPKIWGKNIQSITVLAEKIPWQEKKQKNSTRASYTNKSAKHKETLTSYECFKFQIYDSSKFLIFKRLLPTFLSQGLNNRFHFILITQWASLIVGQMLLKQSNKMIADKNSCKFWVKIERGQGLCLNYCV